MPKAVRIIVTLLITLLTGTLHAGERAHTIRDTDLKAEPFTDAATITQLKANTQVSKTARKGGWYQITFEKREGWVRMTSLRLGEAGKKKGESGIGSTLRFLSTGRSGTSDVTVATGIRGLDAADVANATPDHKALKRLKQKKSAPAKVKNFASAGKLKARKMAYIKEQKKKKSKPAASAWDHEGDF